MVRVERPYEEPEDETPAVWEHTRVRTLAIVPRAPNQYQRTEGQIRRGPAMARLEEGQQRDRHIPYRDWLSSSYA